MSEEVEKEGEILEEEEEGEVEFDSEVRVEESKEEEGMEDGD